jgi:sigma-B regulation protein RsbU (phosphoserine phosphatase)
MKRTSRILVVDDEPGMVRAVERVLGETHTVAGSSSSADAVALATEFRPDLVILDVRMPGLDGFELMARLKTDLPDLEIIMMTGSLDDLDQKLIRAIRGRAFYFIQKPFDREVLRTLVERCLELRWRREQHRRHVSRLEHELREARAFQQTLLPPRELTSGPLAICCRCVPCFELGGDLYDYVAIAPGRVALLIADVMGHGVSAAMLTGAVKSAFRTAEADGYRPAAVVRRLRDSLAAFGPDRFVTLIAALVSADERELVYANAGHPPGLLLTAAAEVHRLAGTGPLVSPALPGCTWEEQRVPLAPGDHLLLYTDGISDAVAGEDDLGEPALLSALQEHADGGSRLLDSLLSRAYERFGSRPQPDDLTLVSAAVRAPTRQAPPATGAASASAGARSG